MGQLQVSKHQASKQSHLSVRLRPPSQIGTMDAIFQAGVPLKARQVVVDARRIALGFLGPTKRTCPAARPARTWRHSPSHRVP